MAGEVTRRQMEAWLLDSGFRRLKGGMSGHLQAQSPPTKPDGSVFFLGLARLQYGGTIT